MPYRVYGGLRFFERAEVKNALAYLRLIENPNDDTSYLRVVNFPTRGIGARSLEQLQDAARVSARSLYQSAGALTGKSGANLRAFNAMVDAMREATRGSTLREIIEHVLHTTGLVDFYRTEKEGADRIETGGTVQRGRSIRPQEGFGGTALPVDDCGRYRRRGAASGGRGRRHARCGDRRDRLAAGSVLDARCARGWRQPGASGARRGAADDGALGQGVGVRLRVHHRDGGRPVPPRELDVRCRWTRRRTPPDVRGDHPCNARTSRSARRACCMVRRAIT